MAALSRLLFPIALVAFVGLGASDALLGTAWPSIRQDYGRPLGDLGIVIAVAIAGFVVTAAANGSMARWLPTGPRLVLSYVALTAGASTIAFGRSWATLLIGAAAIGIGDGILDPTLNAHVGRHHGMGAMNLLHATFGLGATLGPLIMAWALRTAGGWRTGYLVLVVWALAMLAGVLTLRRAWPGPPPVDRADGDGVRGPVVLFLGAFFLATGVEVSAGAWAFTWLVDGRGAATTTAAILTALYWAGFTAARLIGAVIGDRRSPASMISAAGVLLVAGMVWMTVDPAGTGGVGLPVAGAGVALVFPVLVATTVRRFGGRGDTVVGWGFAAASLGAASLPWIVGQVAERAGFGAVGPVLIVGAAAVALAAARVTRSTVPGPTG